MLIFCCCSSNRCNRTCRAVWWSKARIRSTVRPSTFIHPSAPTTFINQSRGMAVPWMVPTAVPLASVISTAAPCTRRVAGSLYTNRWRRHRSRMRSMRSINTHITHINSNSNRRRRRHHRHNHRHPYRTVPSDLASAKAMFAFATPLTRSQARVWLVPLASTYIIIITIIIKSMTAPSPKRKTQ